MGVPGTEGPSPAGLARGEPAGARFTGACTPGGKPAVAGRGRAEAAPDKSGDSPGRAANRADAMRASAAVSSGVASKHQEAMIVER